MRHLLLIALATLSSHVLAQKCPIIPPKFAPVWGDGVSGRVLVSGLTRPRGMVFDTAGNLLVVESGVGVRWLQMVDNGGTDVCVGTKKMVVEDRSLNHGIAIHPTAQLLLVSSQNTVWAHAYNPTTGAVAQRRAIVTDIPSASHSTRTLLVSRKQPDVLLVSVGSNGNLDAGAVNRTEGRAQVRAFRISRAMSRPMRFGEGDVLGWGLRNSVGIAEEGVHGGIWSVENGADNISKSGVDIHNTNPCEELNYHGNLTVRAPLLTGANYGYPTCFAAWDPSVIPNNAAGGRIRVGTQFAIGTNNDTECEPLVPPRLCFAAHTAPLGIAFNRWGAAGYVAFHGSWNRNPPDGYRVSQVRFSNRTGMPIEPSTSRRAAIDIMRNANLAACPGRCFRPVDLKFDSKGRLFMTSDSTGEVWVMGGNL